MKLILGIVLMNLAVCAFGQNSLDCSEVKTGKFKLSDELSGTTRIKRTKKHQIETNDKFNIKAKYEIIWIDDCSYELKDSNGNILIVEILWVKGEIVKVRSTSNFTDLEVEVEMEIIK